MYKIRKYFPITLALCIYACVYWVRYVQGGWDIQIEILEDFRKYLDQVTRNFLPSPQAELLSGILLGNNKDLPGQLRLALRDTSTLHIVVASGQNLSLLTAFSLGLSGLIKRKLAITLSSFLAIFYICLTGAQIPILRAAIMFFMASLAQIVGREKDGIWALIIAAGFMLLINPKWLIDLSFQLSFLATAGVVIVAPLLFKYLDKLPIIGQDLAVTLGAQIMVTPIIGLNFHQFSIVGILTNLLILWTIPVIMILGIIFLLSSFIFSPMATLLALFLNILLTYFIYIVQFFSSFSWAWIYVGEYSWIVWVGYYLIIAGFLKFIYDMQQVKQE